MNNLRDFACEMAAREPYIGASARKGGATATAYIFGNGIHLGCNNKTCPSFESGRYFLGKCTAEQPALMPNRLARAAVKEVKAMEREG